MASMYQLVDSELIDWFHEWLRKDRAYEAMQMLRELARRGLDLSELLEPHHDFLIRFLLNSFAGGSDHDEIADDIAALRRLGVSWPELDIIGKSLRAGREVGEANIEDPVIKQMRKLLGDAQHHGALDLIRRHAIRVSKHPDLIKLLWDNKDAIIRAVKYNLRDKSYGAAYDKIANLLQTGINWPWLREMADAVPKEDVIRHMLMKMKQDNMFGMDDVAYTVRNAKRLGYDWPELDIIHTSLNSRKPVTESALARAAAEEAKQMLWRELPDGNWWTLHRALDNMIYAKVPHSEIFAVLDEYKEDILAQQNRLTQGENSEVLAGVSNLRRLRDIGAGWPEIDQMLTRNKRYIMRAALTEIKHYSTEDYGVELPHIYKNLKQLKVVWPEMAVIADGIDSIQQLGEDQMPNSEKSKVMAEIAADVDMLKQISVRLDYYRELLDKLDALRKSGNDWPELRQFEKTIRRQMKQRYDKIQQELASAHPHAVTDAYIDVEDLLGKAAAKDWLYDNRQAIAHALDRNLAHDGYMRATDILLKRLVGWGAKWPEILSVFAKNKEHLIRDMLVDIKQRNVNPNDITHLQDRVALFKEFVPDWPELDIINKSINAQKISEDWHDVDTDDYDEVYGRMGSALHDIDIGLRTHMEDWHAEIVVNGLADLAQLLDNHDWLSTPTPSEWSLDLVKQKPLFVKALLIGMKHSDTESVEHALRMLEDYWHVRWPELDIMHKSMRAGKQLDEATGPKMIATGAGKIKNPAHSDDAKYEGSPDAYDFGPQKANYDALKALLAQHGSRLTYLAVERSAEGPDTLVATGPGVVWYKKTQWGGGGNWIWINGVKSNLSAVLKLSPAAQDALFTAPQSQVIKATKGKPLAYVKALVADGARGQQLRTEVDSVSDEIVNDVAITVSYKPEKLLVYRRLISRLEHDSGTKLHSLGPQRVIDKAMPMLINQLIGNLRWDTDRFEYLLNTYEANGIKVWPNDIKREITKQWDKIRELLYDPDNIMDGRSIIMCRRLRNLGIKTPDTDEKNQMQLITGNKTIIIKSLLARIREGTAYLVKPKIERLKHAGVTWPELDVMLKSLNASKLAEDWHDVDTDDYDEIYGRLSMNMYEIADQVRNGNRDRFMINAMSEIMSLINQHEWLDLPMPRDFEIDLVRDKTAIMQALLEEVRHGSMDDAELALELLRHWHVKWPELDIMHKSMRAGKVNESVPSHDEEAYNYAEYMAANLPEVAADTVDAMHVFLHAADHPEVIGPWAAEYFLPHKDLWIRFLLEQMKGDEYDTDEIYEAVSMLKRMRLPWPELDVIARSIQGDFRG